MGVFPVNSLFKIQIYYKNGPTNGLSLIQDIKITPIKPNLIIEREVQNYVEGDNSYQNQLKAFNSYKLGDTTTTLTLTIDSLPAQTLKVIVSFTDANDNNICYFDTLNILHCDTFTKTPDKGKIFVDKVKWTVYLDTLSLQLSSKVGIRVFYKNGYKDGTIFTYPLKILPPDIQLLSTDSWQATSNAYDFNDNISNPWKIIDNAYNLQFTPSDLPPQTRKVIYSIIDVDSTIIWVDTVKSVNNRPLVSATSSSLNMRNLDLKAKRLNMKIQALGTPVNGLNYFHDIAALPQFPRISPSALGQYIVRDKADSNDKRVYNLDIKVEPSTKNTDSVKLSWIDNNNFSYFDTTLVPHYDNFCECNLIDFNYDVLSLSYQVKGLRVLTFYKGAPEGGLDTSVAITLLPPPPKVEPVYKESNLIVNSYFDFYPNWRVFNLPEMTIRSIVNITNSINQVVATDTIYANKAPYDYYAIFNNNNTSIKSPKIANISEFTAMTWFNTSSNKGGTIMNISDSSMTPNINIFMTDSGFVAYAIYDKNFKIREIGNTLARYNFNKWHHLAVVFRKKDNKFITNNQLEIYIDGGLVQSILDTSSIFQSNFNPYITLGKGNLPLGIDPTYPFYPANQYYTGLLSDFRFINKALSYSDIMNIVRKSEAINTETAGLQAIWWKLNDVGQSTIKDYNGDNNGTVNGAISWSKILYQSSFNYIFNVKDLQAGKYYLNIIPQYFGGPDIPYSYKVDSINLNYAKTFTNEIDTNTFKLRLTNGLGYFQQGVSQNVNVQVEFKLKSKNKNVYQLYLHIKDKNGNLVKTKIETMQRDIQDSSKLWVGSNIELGTADPGSSLQIIVYNTNNNTNPFYSETPFFTRELPPPLVTYKQGPFLQSIAPNTMIDNQTIVLQNVGDLVEKINLQYYDNSGYNLDKVNVTKDPILFRTWKLNYDMANLRPPFSKFQISQWLQGKTTPNIDPTIYPIEITRTRPLWMNNPSLTMFENVNETSDSVDFNLKFLTVTKTFELVNELKIPSFIPIVGGGNILKAAGLLSVPIGYSKSTGRLRITGDINDQAAVANIELSALKTIKDKFSKVDNDPNYKFVNEYNEVLKGMSSSNKEALKGAWGFEPTFDMQHFYKASIDTNNLINLQTKAKYAIGVRFNIPAIDAAIKAMNAAISDGLAPWSALIRPVFGFKMGLDLYTAERKNLTSDSLGNLKSLGVLELKAGPDGRDAVNTASYNAYGGLFALDFSLSAELALGAIGKVTISLLTNFPLTFAKLYNEYDSKLLYDQDFALFWRVDAYVFFGLIHIPIKPKSMLYHTRIFGDEGDFNLIYEKSKKDSKKTDIILGKVADESDDSWLPQARDVYPQPDFETIDNKTGMIWLEQDPETGYSTIVFSENSKDNSQFVFKKFIYSSNQNINTPKFDYLSNDKIIITFVKNRFNQTNIPTDKQGFDLMNELIKGQDIWYAIYNITNDSVETVAQVPDINTSLTSGRTEGSPEIKAIDQNTAMIVWNVVDMKNQESDFNYSIISNVSDKWQASTPEPICGTIEGPDIDQKISKSNTGELILSWINVSKDQSNRRIMSSIYKDGAWSSCYTVVDELNGSKIGYIDQDFDNKYGALLWTEGRIDSNDVSKGILPNTSIKMLKWNSSIRDWDNSTLETVVDTTFNEIKEPNLEVSDNGKIAILYQNNEMYGPVRKLNALLNNFNNPSKWNHITDSPYICDTNRAMFDYDIAYYNDTLMILSQERIINSTTSNISNYLNGVGIGNDNANLVLRAIKHQGVTKVNEDNIAQNLKENGNGISIYPNPATNYINVKLDKKQKLINFDIIDSKGDYLKNVSYEYNDNSYTIDVSKLSQGIYYFSYISDGIRKTKSFIVIR